MGTHSHLQDLFSLFKNLAKVVFPEALAFVTAQLQRVTTTGLVPQATYQVWESSKCILNAS